MEDYVKYPSYSSIFLGEDKFEKFNRKMFNMNLKVNNLIVKKVHILWASIFPKPIIDSLTHAYENIEYPKRIVSALLQRDFGAIKHETKRFVINTIIGAGGLFDAAYKLFNLEMYNEDMEQALARCKMRCGNYLVMPFISSTTSRDITGRILDFLLTPTTYIATPIAAAIKMGLLINRTTVIQPMIRMVESNFYDPYDIAKKFFGVDKYIKLSNYDRKEVLSNLKDDYDEVDLVLNKEKQLSVKGKVNDKSNNIVVNEILDDELKADIILNDYNPQNPVLDSMRTALFDLKDNGNGFWSDISLFNRDFAKRLKTAKVEIVEGRRPYTFKYLLQKEKQSPLAIIFPSVGEGVSNNHNAIIAKLFYDEGYSVLIFGSHFQWEFFKSVDKNYSLGYIQDDVKYINTLINKSIKYLSNKYDRTFLTRTAIGTSLGAYAVLYLGDLQYEQGANNIDKFIAICPPYELTYAISQLDKIIGCWKNYPNDYKEKVAITAAKVMRAYKEKENFKGNIKALPFSNYEAKLISAFVFHQKLSDLIMAMEEDKNPNADRKELYDAIYKLNYGDYIKKYVLVSHSQDELNAATKLSAISDYLINSNNYKIFHSLDDYLITKEGLKDLKRCCDDKITIFNNGAHLGFMYRDEFINELKKEIKDNKKPLK